MESYEYLDFEDKFRGSRDSIFSSLSHYDSLINTLFDFDPNMNLLDIGCGRGEFLQRYSSKLVDLKGIDKDIKMVELCKKNRINVIQGDALKLLEDFESESFSVITAFHIIEHLTRMELSELVSSCKRILKPNGVLILETPSIDNLIVSTKLFYLDETHINHINPDGLVFSLENIGFDKVNYFLINGGPLQSANSLNLTRVLNGVAQDLLIIGCKNQIMSNLLFTKSTSWQSQLRIAPSTLESASDFDFAMSRKISEWKENINGIEEKLSDVKQNYLKLEQDFLQLRHEMRFFQKIKDLIKMPYVFIKKIISSFSIFLFGIMLKVLNKLLSNRIILDFLLTKKIKVALFNFLSLLPMKIGVIFISKIYNKIDKLIQIDSKSKSFNNQLLDHYNASIKSKYYKKNFNKRIKLK
tara:strand:- start:22499 stop:23734 length:1236 start_codon:yes stop_codon:yes gene_type:complete